MTTLSQKPSPYNRDGEYYVKECDMKPEILDFFQSMFNLESLCAPTLCYAVGIALLKKCVPPEEARYYTFAKVLGFGRNGFIFQCSYKGKERRAVKMTIVSNTVGEKRVNVTKCIVLASMSESQIRKEYQMHRELEGKTTKSSGFRILKIYGDLGVFQPPLYQHKIGVYITQKLTLPTLSTELRRYGATPEMLTKVRQVPHVINAIQEHGYAHSDLHPDNIAFDPDDMDRPYVLDFGRTIHLESTFSNNIPERAIYCLYDYILPLYTLIVRKDPNTASIYNSFLQGLYETYTYCNENVLVHYMPLVPLSNLVAFQEAFRRVLTGEIHREERQMELTHTIYKMFTFKNDTANFFDIAVGRE